MRTAHTTFLKLLKDRSFALYLLTSFLATFGNGLSYITTNWLVLSVRNNPLDVVIMMICFWLPSALLAPYWGVCIDRWSRKGMLLTAQAARSLIMIGFGIFFYYYALSTTSLNLLTLLSGSLFSMIFPATMALVRELVIEQNLLYANTMIDITYEIGSVIGMGSAGLLLVFCPPHFAFMINGLVFLLSALVLCGVSPRYPFLSTPSTANRTVGGDLLAGIHYILSNRALTQVYILQLMIFTSVMITPVLIGPFSKTILHANAAQFSMIEMALSAGIVIGGILVPLLTQYFGLHRGLLILTASLTLFYSLFSINHYLSIAVILYFLIGFVLSCWPVIVTQAQNRTAPHYQGRVQSVFASLSSLLILSMYLIIALGTHFISIHCLYVFPALLALAATYCVMRTKDIYPSHHG